MSLQTLIESYQLNVFLLDASGVLYSDLGPTPNISETVKTLQETGDVFVLTNNSYLSAPLIETLLAKHSVHIPATNILSSGHGLERDPKINRFIRGKTVYVFGTDASYPYVTDAGGTVTPNLKDCDTIALCASLRDKTDAEYDKVSAFLNSHPEIDIVCCNPDRFVRGRNGHHPVIGWWAEKLETELGRTVHWFGKPLENYSKMVQTFLASHLKNGFDPQKACFFDDNPENLIAMVKSLNIRGCWITDTGLQSDPKQVQQLFESNSVNIPALGQLSY